MSLSSKILVADIGGTNARFAVYDLESKKVYLEQVLPTKDFDNLDGAIASYLDGIDEKLNYSVIDVACPVVDDIVNLTNNHWCFSQKDIQKKFDFKKSIFINDFAALALSILLLQNNELKLIKEGVSQPYNNIAVLGPGTGLGVGGLVYDKINKGYNPLAGEGGHASFSPSDSLEIEIYKNLQAKFKTPISYEHLLSGSGMVNLYNSLREVQAFYETPQYSGAKDITMNIDNLPLAKQTVLIFLGILGRVASNIALTFGAWQGVYIGGGIVPKIKNLIEESSFVKNFEEHSKHARLLKETPIYLITQELKALEGCGVLAQYLMFNK